MRNVNTHKPMLAVRTADYLQQVTPLPFVGLPREEIERLYGAVEVLALDRTDPACSTLAAYAVVHYNYAWLVGLDGAGSFGKLLPLPAANEAPLFLDDALHMLARSALEPALPAAHCDWRCAGLIHHAGQLALVYVVRLRQRWNESAAAPALRVISNGELQTERARFDPFGQFLIANLAAL